VQGRRRGLRPGWPFLDEPELLAGRVLRVKFSLGRAPPTC